MKLAENEFAKGEYMLDWTFYDGDGIKVAKIENGAIKTWYKDGMDNEYKITEEGGKTGEGTLYFRPNGNAEWPYFYLTVIPKTQPSSETETTQATETESTEATTESTEPTTESTEATTESTEATTESTEATTESTEA